MFDLFGNKIESSEKGYRAIRHDIARKKQAVNADIVHHPREKEIQIRNTLQGKKDLKILELFSGRGNMTSVFSEFGTVHAHDKKYLRTGDSYKQFHKYIFERKLYNVIDLDPYGFPNRFFPDIFLLIESGFLFVTMPKPYVNILNGITATHLTSYYGESNPPLSVIQERIVLWALCHWRKAELLSCLDLKSIWRLAFAIEKVKATEYTGVKNR